LVSEQLKLGRESSEATQQTLPQLDKFRNESKEVANEDELSFHSQWLWGFSPAEVWKRSRRDPTSLIHPP